MIPEQGKITIGCAGAADGRSFKHYAEMAAKLCTKLSPIEEARTGINNALSFTGLSLKSGALDDHSIELIDQAEAIMKMVLSNLQKEPLPPEFGYHMANAVNELQACTKLCSGKLQASVFDLSAAVEKLRGEHE